MFKVYIPRDREWEYEDDCEPETRRQYYYNLVQKETRLYDSRLRSLQGTVVPTCYGLWGAAIPGKKETAYIMLLERVENTIISHLIPGGR